MTAAHGGRPLGGGVGQRWKRFTFSVAFRVGNAMFDKNVKKEIIHIKTVSKLK
jgi:hypothetical protein